MQYCYIRVSTDKQEFDRQVDIFKSNGYINSVNCKYIEETHTGKTTKRPIYNELIETMQEGDTLVVESLTRLSRAGIIKTLEEITALIQNKRINVVIIKENFNLKAGEKPDANTNMLLGIFSVLAQFERDLISERTKEALQAKKSQGVKLGRNRTAQSSKDNFIHTIKIIINNKIGIQKATLLTGYPFASFIKDIKKYYNQYGIVTDGHHGKYQELLEKMLEDNDK